MNAIKRFITTVPAWAFLLSLVAVYTNTVYFLLFISISPNIAAAMLWCMFILMNMISLSSLYLLYKKSGDKTLRLFFIFLHCLIITVYASYLEGKDIHSLLANIAFIICGGFISPSLIHFMLIFPKPSRIIERYKYFPWIFYSFSVISVLLFLSLYIHDLITGKLFSPVFIRLNIISLLILFIEYFIALGIAVLQYFTIKDTFSRNQIRILLIGAIFVPLLVIPLSIDSARNFLDEFPHLLVLMNGGTRMFLAGCILIAILRYRVWDIEVVLRKALLYLGATAMIILTYLLLLFLVDLLTVSEAKSTRFIILAVSVILFLMMRDRIQKLIDRLFHREAYDSATVVAEFEEKMSGGYKIEDLGLRILNGLEDIFHFKSFSICLKESNSNYIRAFSIGPYQEYLTGKFMISHEFEKKLIKSKVFSPAELIEKPDYDYLSEGELIVPMVQDNEPFGFFLCGPKKSEKTYSMQDIRVLSLIAKRVIALFQTASLYQKDLDRQLMLERERARISQDMHDDIGASLTRISMMSEMVKNREDVGDGARQWLGQISGTSRGLMEEMNQIIWALNPRNDNVEGLVTYIRRFAFEYLEPAAIKCHFDLPQVLQEKKLNVETRRNIYLVVREALHNVVKHSGATGVDIRLSIFDCRFSISIRDDGKGFDPDKLEFPGNGLINMKKRMRDIGGEIEFNSELGIGTEIKLIISL